MKRHPRKSPAAKGRAGHRGFMLIEALVSLLIFAFGVLGIVGLQAAMTKAQTQSKFRADASLLAQQLIGAMWTDRANMANYATGSCTGYTRCSQWATRVAAALPNGAADVQFPSASEVSIRITWTPPNDSQHNYTVASAILAPDAP